MALLKLVHRTTTAATAISSSKGRLFQFFSTQLSCGSLVLSQPCLWLWHFSLSCSALCPCSLSPKPRLNRTLGRNAVGWHFSFPCGIPTSSVLDYPCLINPLVCSPLCVILPLALRIGFSTSMALPCPFLLKLARCREVWILALIPSLQAEGWQSPSLKLLGGLSSVLSASRTTRLKFVLLWWGNIMIRVPEQKNVSTNKTRQSIILKSDVDHHGSNVILNVRMQLLCEAMTLRDLLAQQLHCVYPVVQKVMEWTSFSHNF